MIFRVGQKVVCVDSSPRDDRRVDLVKGQIYTVKSFCWLWKHKAIHLQEVNGPCGDPFWADRFRPIVERKTDITVFTEILRKATKPARSPLVALHQRA